MIESAAWEWALPSDLTRYIITTIFEQPRLDSSALIRGRLPEGQVLAWLSTGKHYESISIADYDKFKRASRSRGGVYSIEVCEFVVEEVMLNGDVVVNFWRRVRDDTGQGGRIILGQRGGKWQRLQHLGGWENHL